MIRDVTEGDFQDLVVERSRSVPVVVDFWAAWCGPCRTLGPLLEAAAGTREGKVDLAKVDVDGNQNLARSFGVQGIPAVKAFRDGAVVDEFVGAVPGSRVEAFFDGLAPSEAEELDTGDEASLRRALELEPGRADVAVALARLLLERGEPAEALALLENVSGSFQADGLAARIALEREPEPGLQPAFAALDAGDRALALELLLEALRAADGRQDEVRRVLVGVLDELGVEDPLAREYRRRLATALY